MKNKHYLLTGFIFLHIVVHAQVKIGDNPDIINSASLLELQSTNKGLVLPRVSITDVSASSPLPSTLLEGTIVYNTNSTTIGGSGTGIYYWDGSNWNFLANTTTALNYWSLTGNSGTSASTNFIGTSDATDFVTRTNNIERMRILGAANGSSKAGWIGMGITVPRSSLDVTGDFTNKNVITIQNTSSTGYSSVDMIDNSGNLKGTFGYANAATGGFFAGKDYFNVYSSDFVFTNNSGSYNFFLNGSTGYIGLNTNTPSERLHLVGNFYLNGAFMPGGSAGTSGYVLTSAGTGASPAWTNPSSIGWSLTGNSGTAPSTNFIGTTDAAALVFKTNNTEEMRLTSGGALLINTSTAAGSEVLNANGSFKLGANGSVLTNIYKTSASLTIPSSVTGLFTVTKTVAVANAPLNSTVIVNPQTNLPSGVSIAYSYVSSANIITIGFTGLLSLLAATTINFDITVIY